MAKRELNLTPEEAFLQLPENLPGYEADIGVRPTYAKAEFPGEVEGPTLPAPAPAPAGLPPEPVGRFATERVGEERGAPLTQAELEYLATKYGGPQAGIYAPGQADLTGGQRITSAATGGEITLPPGQGVNLETLYVMDPQGFAKSFPAFVTSEGEFNRSAVEESRMRKAGIGPPPPEGYQPAPKPDFSPEGRQRFQQLIFQNIGFNPMTFDPYSAAQDQASQRYPELFARVLPGVPWSERSNLTQQQNETWTRSRQAMLAKYEQLSVSRLAQAQKFWQESMKEFDARYAKAMIATEKTAETAKVAVGKEYATVIDDLRQRLKLTKETEFKDPENQAHMDAILKRFYTLTQQGLKPREAENKAVEEVDSYLDKYFKAMDAAKGKKEVEDNLRNVVKKALNYVPTRRRGT
jgi:hypothetical protein